MSEDEDDDDEDVDYSRETEIRFAPSDGVVVRDLFNAMQECNKLHSCEDDDMVSEDSEEEDEDANGQDSGDVDMAVNGNHVPGQFDDAE